MVLELIKFGSRLGPVGIFVRTRFFKNEKSAVLTLKTQFSEIGEIGVSSPTIGISFRTRFFPKPNTASRFVLLFL